VLAGAHVSTSGGIHTALDRAEDLEADAVQIFTQSPRAWRPTNHDPANFDRFKERRSETGVGAVFCHAVYLINLAAPDDTVYEKSRAALENTLDVASAIDAEGVVVHVCSHLGAGLEAGLERAVPALEAALGHCSDVTHLLLENSAGTGGTIGRSVDELVVLFDRLGRDPCLGLCLDSCHLWASGTDVTDRKALDALLEDVDARIGLDRLRCVHVNDSEAGLGSNRDRHANVGEGEIGDELGVFLSHPRLEGLPMILEVPGPDGHGPDAHEVRKLRELYARWTRGAKRRRSGRRPGRTASRGGARRTRG
jgi:deoxyribonuclease IV